MQDKWVDVGAKLRDQKRHAVGHEAADEVDVTAQAVQLRHSDSAALLASGRERGGKLRTAPPRARFDHAPACSGPKATGVTWVPLPGGARVALRGAGLSEMLQHNF